MIVRTLLVFVLLGCVVAWSKDRLVAPPQPALRVVQLPFGLRTIAPKNDLARLSETTEYEQAQKVGLDLLAPNHDVLVHRFTGERLFYIFFKTVDDAYGPKKFMLQRVKKTVRDWSDLSEPPRETVTYLVEAFKTLGGMLKRPDRHYGYFALGDHKKRQIVKEYEIGYGEIPGTAEGIDWPFASNKLYVSLYGYGPDQAQSDALRFSASTTWTLDVEFSKDGTYAIRSPELAIDAPARLPTYESGNPAADPKTRNIVLTEGQGMKGLALGDSADRIAKVLGQARFVIEYPSGREAHRTKAQITLKLGRDGTIDSFYTHSSFAGTTSKGIGHGAYRGQVLSAYGPPTKGAPSATSWRYPGILFDFDSFQRVRRIVILK